MNLRRGATETIWKTVVFAGAMLGSAAGCSKSKPPVAPQPDPMAQQADPNDPEAKKKQPDPCADPCAEANPCGDEWTDPCADRVRGSSDEGGEGRGFILS